MLGLSAANLAVAFGQGFPVAGGLSQSAVNDNAGAKSQLALVVASVTLGICLLFLTSLLKNLPTVVLASIVLVAVKGLIDVKALRQLREVSRFEFSISMVALIGVLMLGILKGVLLAAIVSLLMLITVAARPHVAFLGRISGSRRYSDIERHPDNECIPGVLIFRVESPLLSTSTSILFVRSCGIESGSADRLRLVVCDLSNAPWVDVAGASLLSSLQKQLAEQGVSLHLAEAHAHVRDLLRAAGLEHQVGYFGRHTSIDQVLTEFEQSKCPTPSLF